MQATVRSFDPHTRSGTVLTDDGVELPYTAGVVAPRLRMLRIGQRVRIEVDGSGADARVRSLTIYTLPD
jgi:2-phospho-L-lactate guanylyltransferase